MVGLNSGFQPLFDKDEEICLVVNGEIYNYKKLESDLFVTNPEFKTEFQTKSDCEVIIFLYKKYGKHFMKKVDLNGMFGFATGLENNFIKLILPGTPFRLIFV